VTQEVEALGWIVLLTGAVVAAALVFHPVSERTRVPAPAFFLLAAALASDLVPGLRSIPVEAVQRLVTVALIFVLLDGGASLGWRRLRASLTAASWMGLGGTVVIAGTTGALAHVLLGFSWQPALLLGIALAPTDPAAVFSALGRKEIGGRSGTLLYGEAGLNDPAGIALLAGVLEVGDRTGGAAFGHVALIFVEQIAIGVAIGVCGGLALLQVLRRVPLPGQGLYSLVVLAGALVVYGLATVSHGSGFLAVFLAGILIGDERAPYKREIEQFAGALASLSEIVAFVVLGLSVQVGPIVTGPSLWKGLLVAALLMVVVRPVLVGAVLAPI